MKAFLCYQNANTISFSLLFSRWLSRRPPCTRSILGNIIIFLLLSVSVTWTPWTGSTSDTKPTRSPTCPSHGAGVRAESLLSAWLCMQDQLARLVRLSLLSHGCHCSQCANRSRMLLKNIHKSVTATKEGWSSLLPKNYMSEELVNIPWATDLG